MKALASIFFVFPRNTDVFWVPRKCFLLPYIYFLNVLTHCIELLFAKEFLEATRKPTKTEHEILKPRPRLNPEP